MANDYSMADISSLRKSLGTMEAINSTSRKGNTELDMTDFLKLMIVQLQSQTLDDTMDTSEMMNQMVQMQMVTAITNMTETNIMTYASSLVGKEVTIGIINGDTLEERLVDVIGTGMSDGQQVIFGKDKVTGKVETYNLNQIMAVGQLPPLEEEEGPGDTTQRPGDAVQQPGGTTQVPGATTDKPVDGTGTTQDQPEQSGEEPDASVEPSAPVV